VFGLVIFVFLFFVCFFSAQWVDHPIRN